MPKTLRDDYVFNANDSFWTPSAEFQLGGDYSVLHGEQDAALSMRTRQNIGRARRREHLATRRRLTACGTPTRLKSATFDNLAQTALLLRARWWSCAKPIRSSTSATSPSTTARSSFLPRRSTSTAACNVLAAWDGRFDLDSAGALLWREVLAAIRRRRLHHGRHALRHPLRPAQPYSTPGGFSEDGTTILQALARGVQTLVKAGFAVDSTLGTAQFTDRSGERISLHGGTNREGVTNVVTWSNRGSSSEPAPTRGDVVAPGGALRGNGHPVNFGSSFVLVVDYSATHVEASAILTYGQTGQRDSDVFASQTVRFSEKNWRTVAFTDEQILADPGLTDVTITQP